MRGSMSLGSHDLEAADARRGECPSWLTTVELASIICTGSTSVMWALSAAERRKVQWKGVPVQRKGVPVQRKASRSAAESWSSQMQIQKLHHLSGSSVLCGSPDWCDPGDSFPGRRQSRFCRFLWDRQRA